jgi:hypothetical protein
VTDPGATPIGAPIAPVGGKLDRISL